MWWGVVLEALGVLLSVDFYMSNGDAIAANANRKLKDSLKC